MCHIKSPWLYRAGVYLDYTSKSKRLADLKALDMREWRNGRRAGLRNQCPRGVWVRVPPCVPMRSYTWILKIKLLPAQSVVMDVDSHLMGGTYQMN